MADQNKCPQCGATLSAGASEGLCPACLLKRGLDSQTLGYTDDAGPAQSWTPPTGEELAASFPELEILELIGRGGMGAVYKARQKNLDRLVALKILPPQIGRDPAFAQRFAREAQAMARLGHPHIVILYEFGQRGELFFFVMEYVDGLSLRQLLDRGGVSPKEALAIVPQICEALQYAHDRGIVHRDIKPENILLNRQGQVKIADFGLAKLMGQVLLPLPPGEGGGEGAAGNQAGPSSQAAGSPSGNRSRPAEGSPLTPTLSQRERGPEQTLGGERVMGTPQYMAPEQATHPAEVDHRADIYSLGVVFYQMLTGELPRGRFEPPSRKVQIDVRLDEVVLRALEKEPERRYQQASEVKTQVETIVTTTGTTPIKPQRKGLINIDAEWSWGEKRRWRWKRTIPIVGTSHGQTVIHWPGFLFWWGLQILLISGAFFVALVGQILIQDGLRINVGPLPPLVPLAMIAWSVFRARRMLKTPPELLTPLDAPPSSPLALLAALTLPPLLALDVVVAWILLAFHVGVPEIVIVCVILDAALAFWAWRAANRPLGAAFGDGGSSASALSAGRTPAEKARSAIRSALGNVAWHAVLLFLVVGTFFAFVVPRFAATFADFNATLPPLTRLVIDISSTLRHPTLFWLLLVPLAVVALALDVGLCFTAQYLVGPWLRRLWSMVVLVGLAAFVALSTAALSLPMAGLVKALTPATPGAQPAFGPVIERVLAVDLVRNVVEAMNLETGRITGCPRGLRKDDENTSAWMRGNQLDLWADFVPGRGLVLVCFDMAVMLVDQDRWDRTTANELLQDKRLAGISPPRMSIESAGTLFFRTRNGQRGMLQILGVTDNPKGVKIRYKLVQPGGTPATQPGRTLHFVQIVVGLERMTFEGQTTTWEQLPALLAKVPNRPNTVLAVAIDPQKMQKLLVTDEQSLQFRVGKLAQQFGFAYASYVGEHPLGEKGSPPVTVQGTPAP